MSEKNGQKPPRSIPNTEPVNKNTKSAAVAAAVAVGLAVGAYANGLHTRPNASNGSTPDVAESIQPDDGYCDNTLTVTIQPDSSIREAIDLAIPEDAGIDRNQVQHNTIEYLEGKNPKFDVGNLQPGDKLKLCLPKGVDIEGSEEIIKIPVDIGEAETLERPNPDITD